jgi:hypothetical protein
LKDVEVMPQSTMLPPPAEALQPHVAARRDARALLAAAVDAFREGRAAPPPAPIGGPSDGQLNEQFVAYMYRRLDQAERGSLSKVGEMREQALALSRAGRQEEAEATMKLTRFFLSVAGLSPMGRAAADTLQHAAEGYLSYRRGDFAEGSRRMDAAVDATDRLADAWGENFFTSARRVHLLHNQMKVEVRRGAVADAVRLGAGILAYAGGSSAGPIPAALARTVSAMEPAIAHKFCNIIGAALAEALAGLPDDEARELLGLLDGVEPAGLAADARAWAWLPLKSAALADDPSGFLQAAAPFLRAGSTPAPVLWYAVALDVVRAARAVGAGDADGIAEIEAALATDPRVTKALQAAAREG